MTQRPAFLPTQAPRPWYRYGLVWMVLGGPAVVVVASFITLYLAVTRPDPVLDSRPAPVSAPTGLAPAMEARNHAATAAHTPADAP